ncbi:MAG: hypothetical protein D4Q79_00975 [Spirochaetia bacterium]|nr:MAG: hypothetical protein D4Q79_00975 [Spirochaetia bacterium]
MSKLNKILLAVVVVLIIVLAGVIYWQNFKKSGGDDYWAVYLSTGDIYIGKPSYFPRFHLSDVWFFQKTSDAQNPLSLAKFSQAFWGPEDNLYLSEKQIIWKSKLSETSQVISYIKNSQAAQPQIGPQAQIPTPTPAQTGETGQ